MAAVLARSHRGQPPLVSDVVETREALAARMAEHTSNPRAYDANEEGELAHRTFDGASCPATQGRCAGGSLGGWRAPC